MNISPTHLPAPGPSSPLARNWDSFLQRNGVQNSTTSFLVPSGVPEAFATLDAAIAEASLRSADAAPGFAVVHATDGASFLISPAVVTTENTVTSPRWWPSSEPSTSTRSEPATSENASQFFGSATNHPSLVAFVDGDTVLRSKA